MKKLLPIGTRVKINCTYPWQTTEAVIVETPTKHLNIPDDHPYSPLHGQWMNDGKITFHLPFSRFEAIEQAARASPSIQKETAPELTGESCFKEITKNTKENFSTNKQSETMPNIEDLARALDLKMLSDTYHGDCPVCGYKNGLSLSEKNGTVLAYCHACQADQRELWRTICSISKYEFPSLPLAKPAKVAKVSSSFLEQWNKSEPASGSLVEEYLVFRGLNPNLSELLDIRFLSNAFHSESKSLYPVMLCAIRDLESNIIGVHRTYLASNGKGKAPVEVQKKILGKTKGGFFQTVQPQNKLIICEGIENALTLYQVMEIPTWAAISAGNLPNLRPPKNLEIILALDNDPAGLQFGEKALNTWTSLGLDVKVAKPPRGKDFNDLLKTGD